MANMWDDPYCIRVDCSSDQEALIQNNRCSLASAFISPFHIFLRTGGLFRKRGHPFVQHILKSKLSKSSFLNRFIFSYTNSEGVILLAAPAIAHIKNTCVCNLCIQCNWCYNVGLLHVSYQMQIKANYRHQFGKVFEFIASALPSSVKQTLMDFWVCSFLGPCRPAYWTRPIPP